MLIHLLYNTIAVLCWNDFAASDVYQFDKVIKNNEEILILVTFVAMLILVSSILAIWRIVKA